MENFTESVVQQSKRSVVRDLQKVPLQAFLSVPAESVSAIRLHPLGFICRVAAERFLKVPVFVR